MLNLNHERQRAFVEGERSVYGIGLLSLLVSCNRQNEQDVL